MSAISAPTTRGDDGTSRTPVANRAREAHGSIAIVA